MKQWWAKLSARLIPQREESALPAYAVHELLWLERQLERRISMEKRMSRAAGIVTCVLAALLVGVGCFVILGQQDNILKLLSFVPTPLAGIPWRVRAKVLIKVTAMKGVCEECRNAHRLSAEERRHTFTLGMHLLETR